MVVLNVFPLPVIGQDAASEAVSADDQYRQALAAINRQDHRTAIPLLKEIIEVTPTYRGKDGRSAYYWLGFSQIRGGQDQEGAEAWRRGRETLASGNVPTAFISDRYVRHVFQKKLGSHYNAAVRAYYSLIRDSGAELEPRARMAVNQHLVLLKAIAPPPIREAIGWGRVEPKDRVEEQLVGTLDDEDKATLIEWLQGLDPSVSTLENERVDVHLLRSIKAMSRYSKKGHIDDRGRVYVRFGDPYRMSEIPNAELGFLAGTGRYQGNEIWVYRGIPGNPGYFFGEVKSGYYQLMVPSEFLPAELRSGTSRRATDYLRAMEVVYRRLSLLHPDYMDVYTKIGYAIDEINMMQIAPGSMSSGTQTPATLARSLMLDLEYDETRTAQRRQEDTDTDFVPGIDDVVSAPLVARTARFLKEDGSTRLELYWGVDPAGLRVSRILSGAQGPSSNPVGSAIIQYIRLPDESSGEKDVRSKRYIIPPSRKKSYIQEESIGDVLTGDAVEVQWDVHSVVLEPDATTVRQISQPQSTKRLRVPSFSPLRSQGPVEMSDLKPISLPEDSLTVADPAKATPYPYHTIVSSASLAFYFEIYNLSKEEGDQTRYNIDYEVKRVSDGERIDSRTTTTTPYRSFTSNTKESIIIDLSDISEAQMIEVTVRVTDRSTEETVERSIVYQIVEEEL